MPGSGSRAVDYRGRAVPARGVAATTRQVTRRVPSNAGADKRQLTALDGETRTIVVLVSEYASAAVSTRGWSGPNACAKARLSAAVSFRICQPGPPMDASSGYLPRTLIASQGRDWQVADSCRFACLTDRIVEFTKRGL